MFMIKDCCFGSISRTRILKNLVYVCVCVYVVFV